MNCLLFVIIGLVIFEDVNSYVLQNASITNGDAPILKHPSERSDKLSRRKFPMKRTRDNTNDANSLENIVLAIDTGVKHLMAGKRPDVIDTITTLLAKFAKNNVVSINKAKTDKYDIKPEIVHFRSENDKDKPSVVFELNSKSIVNVLKDVLASKTVLKYMDKLSKDAGIVYRALKREKERDYKSNINNEYVSMK